MYKNYKWYEHVDELVITSLFAAYELVPDAEFEHVMRRKRDKQDTNFSVITPAILLSKTIRKYNVLRSSNSFDGQDANGTIPSNANCGCGSKDHRDEQARR